MLEFVGLKIKKKTKDWFNNFTGETKLKSWEQFLTLFFKKFSTKSYEISLPSYILVEKKRSENLKICFTNTMVPWKNDETVVKREVAIRSTKV